MSHPGAEYPLLLTEGEDFTLTFWFAPGTGSVGSAFVIVDSWDGLLDPVGSLVAEVSVPVEVAPFFPDETDLWKAVVSSDDADITTARTGGPVSGRWRLRMEGSTKLYGPVDIQAAL